MLPSAGAAVAFVGAGGAGKTRCAAALANAYASASTLPVSVVSLTAGGHRNDIVALLASSGVPVQVANGPAAAETIAGGREAGLVVIDTAATSPVDEAGIARLAAELGELELDAVYLTLPATLSASAGRRLIQRLAPIGASAIVITHADESDELGIATELAHLSGLPIAYIHSSLPLDTPLAIADPARVAARILP
jgi:flagellar biosynthesis GTPase FlhF